MFRLRLWHHLSPSFRAHQCLLHMLSSPTKLPFFSETLPTPFSSMLFRTCPSKIKSSEYLEATLLVSYIPQTKAELWAIVKDFLEVTKDPHRSSVEDKYSHSNVSISVLWLISASKFFLSVKARPSVQQKLLVGKILKGLENYSWETSPLIY